MKYRVVKYKKKRKIPFETYEPKQRIKINRENTVPFMVRVGNRVAVLGGLIGFWAAGFLMALKGVFSAEEHFKRTIRRFSFNNKIVEIRVRKK